MCEFEKQLGDKNPYRKPPTSLAEKGIKIIDAWDTKKLYRKSWRNFSDCDNCASTHNYWYRTYVKCNSILITELEPITSNKSTEDKWKENQLINSNFHRTFSSPELNFITMQCWNISCWILTQNHLKSSPRMPIKLPLPKSWFFSTLLYVLLVHYMYKLCFNFTLIWIKLI